ncbi:hypothetical protein [Zunongwangia sp.]|uniref:hypothetical protein n=1 Tax=Zunongwangia sp. TaxID=1965325 RepID=UPI003AA86BE4
MPAQKKYLTQKVHQKIAKFTAGFFGGYLLSALFHMVLALWLPNQRIILITSIYTLFLLWMLLFIIPYLFKNGWKVWGIYILVATALYAAYHYGEIIHAIS